MSRPFVYVNMAATVDGKITSAGREYPDFTSDADRDEMDRLRAEADAILVGAQTLRADNPMLHVRSDEMRAHRRALGKPESLLRVMVTASCRIEPTSRFFDTADGDTGCIIATVEDAPQENLAALEDHAEVWQIGRGKVDLKELLRRLADRGVARLLAEGGGELNWALIQEDLVDELYITYAPALLGGRNAPTLLEGEGFPMNQKRRLHLESVRQVADELFCRYSLLR